MLGALNPEEGLAVSSSGHQGAIHLPDPLGDSQAVTSGEAEQEVALKASHSLCFVDQKIKEPIWLKSEPARAQSVHSPFVSHCDSLSLTLGYPRKDGEQLDRHLISLGNYHEQS